MSIPQLSLSLGPEQPPPLVVCPVHQLVIGASYSAMPCEGRVAFVMAKWQPGRCVLYQ
jgi:hypothetical protein